MVEYPSKNVKNGGVTIKNRETWWNNNQKIVKNGGVTIKNRETWWNIHQQM